MYNFILQTIVMLSLGTMIYLVARAVPRLSETTKIELKKDYLEKWLKKLPLEKADAWMNMVLEKFLRRTKVTILKLDNLISKRLTNLKPGNDNELADRPNLFEKKEESDILNK